MQRCVGEAWTLGAVIRSAGRHRGAAESMNLHAPQETQTLPLVAGSPAQRAEICRLRHGIVSVRPAER